MTMEALLDAHLFLHSLMGSSDRMRKLQRRLAWPLRKDENDKSRSARVRFNQLPLNCVDDLFPEEAFLQRLSSWHWKLIWLLAQLLLMSAWAQVIAPWRVDLPSIQQPVMDDYDCQVLRVTRINGTLQTYSAKLRRLAWPLLKDDIHKSRSANVHYAPREINDGRPAEELLCDLKVDDYDSVWKRPTVPAYFLPNPPIQTYAPVLGCGAESSNEILGFWRWPLRAAASRIHVLVDYTTLEFFLRHLWETREMSSGSHCIAVLRQACDGCGQVNGGAFPNQRALEPEGFPTFVCCEEDIRAAAARKLQRAWRQAASRAKSAKGGTGKGDKSAKACEKGGKSASSKANQAEIAKTEGSKAEDDGVVVAEPEDWAAWLAEDEEECQTVAMKAMAARLRAIPPPPFGPAPPPPADTEPTEFDIGADDVPREAYAIGDDSEDVWRSESEDDVEDNLKQWWNTAEATAQEFAPHPDAASSNQAPVAQPAHGVAGSQEIEAGAAPTAQQDFTPETMAAQPGAEAEDSQRRPSYAEIARKSLTTAGPARPKARANATPPSSRPQPAPKSIVRAPTAMQRSAARR